MKISVKNTIDNTIEYFDNIDDAKNHIKTEIRWFNSPNENKNGLGYNDHDFIIEEI